MPFANFDRRAAAFAWLACLAALAAGSSAHAGAILIYNTGVDAAGTPATPTTIDLHYALISSVDPSFPGPAAYISDPALYPISTNDWVAGTAVSQWISPGPDPSTPYVAGPYIYRTTFDLIGLSYNTATVSGQWAADNATGSGILLNGVDTGNSLNGIGFDGFTPFFIGSEFVAGVNTLDFVVFNEGGPTGLHVQVSGAADSVPEPATVFLMIAAAAVGLGARVEFHFQKQN